MYAEVPAGAQIWPALERVSSLGSYMQAKHKKQNFENACALTAGTR